MIYGKMMSAYKGRVASAETAGEFAAIWLTILSIYVVLGIALYVYIDGDGMLEAFITLCLFLVILASAFQEPDVRFWDPRVYFLKGHADKIDIEKTRKIHLDGHGHSLAGAMFFLLSALVWIIIIFVPVFAIILFL